MLEELEKEISAHIQELNNRGIADFEWYSPNQMQALLYTPFEEQCPVRLKPLTPEQYSKIPILQLAKHLMFQVQQAGEIKLTPKGWLPVKLVKELYGLGLYKEEMIESGISKLNRHEDSLTLLLMFFLVKDLTQLTKVRHGKLSLTKKGMDALKSDHELLFTLLRAVALRYNFGYFDGYEDGRIGQIGFAFSFMLVGKYGGTKQQTDFYADKYFRALPMLSKTKSCKRSYSLRTFERMLAYFGLVEFENVKDFHQPEIVWKTDIFDALVHWDVPKSGSDVN